ncbi:MAG: carbon starvation CstA family protein [Candidatus Bathyarchaeia archaeon]
MLSVLVIVTGLVLYGLAYYGYVKWFDRNVIQSDPKRTTPAATYMDGIEFFPTNRYILFGFQWKSIAALGPVIGPIMAIQWGWLPAVLWILFGTIFIGWIHDYTSMMVSVRSEGASFGPVTYEVISPRARTILLSYILFYLILILSSFTNVVSGTFATFPVSPIPVLVVTLVGVLSGYLVYKYKVNIVYTTIFAIVLMAVGIWLGMVFPVTVPKEIALDFWMFWTLLFCFVGAVLPIWVFIQPINYMSFYLVYAAVIGIIGGIFAGYPGYSRDALTTFFDPKVTPSGPLWPMMFVVVACGAISGWHSLIGSSVSSKQLESESDARFVGGGAMIAEGILALVALTTVAILTPDAVKGVAPAGIFIKGGSTLLGYLGLPATVGSAYLSVVIIILAITIMHIALRISRLAASELAGPRFGGIFRNIYLSAIIVSIVVYIVTSPRFGAAFSYIWGTFGGANQLMAGMALMICTLWLTKNRRPTIYTAVPMAFMLVTTISALIYLVYSGVTLYVTDPTKIGAGIATVINILLLILAFVMCYEGARAFRRLRAASK